MKKNLILLIVPIFTSLAIALLFNFIALSLNPFIERSYGQGNFTGWLVTEDTKTYFLKSQLTADRDNLYMLRVPLKIESRINPSGTIYFGIKNSDQINLVTKVAVDNFSQELYLDVDTSLIKKAKNRIYELELDIDKISSPQVPVFNRKPFIIARYKKIAGLPVTNVMSYLHDEINTVKTDFNMLFRPIVAIIFLVTLLMIVMIKKFMRKKMPFFDIFFLSLGLPLVVVYGQFIFVFFLSLFVLRTLMASSKKINPLHIFPFIFFSVSLIFFISFNQVSGNRLAFFGFMLLSFDLVIEFLTLNKLFRWKKK